MRDTWGGNVVSWGFEVDRVYNRRADIHARFGGQQQGGIITPANHPLVIIITGEEGLQHGYADRHRPDGVFEYFGEGQIGDMPWVRGNRAIREHSADGRSLLLFKKEKTGLRYQGELVYDDFHIEQAPDREGAMRAAIVFELRYLNAVEEAVAAEIMPTSDNVSLDDLRKRAFAAISTPADATTTATRTVYQRSRDVKVYVLKRAKGRCEGCRQPAPFLRADGSPYLEPHHIRRVSDGGPDDPRYVIAVCPNCHRRVHAGADGQKYNAELLGLMPKIEPGR
jgi:5-methylcytosine-specific restriction protein A